MAKPIKVSKERFQQEVSLWRYKGHEHVVRAVFNSSTIFLYVNDYVTCGEMYMIVDEIKD